MTETDVQADRRPLWLWPVWGLCLALWTLVSTAIVGLFFGGLARLVLPGTQPIGALATMAGDTLSFIGEVLSPDGTRRWRRAETIALGADAHDQAASLGRKLGTAIRAEAGEAFIQNLEKRGW